MFNVHLNYVKTSHVHIAFSHSIFASYNLYHEKAVLDQIYSLMET